MSDFVPWLRTLAEQGGRGVVNNIDARCLGRIADELERLRSIAIERMDLFRQAATKVEELEAARPEVLTAGAISEIALEAATKAIYEDKGDRKGVMYIGWEHEPEDVKARWRVDVRFSVEKYLASLPVAQAVTDPLQAIHDAVNALGGRSDQDNSYDQGIVDTVAKVLDIIERAQAVPSADCGGGK